MFEVFGEMESYEEINKTAAGLLNEGDTENIRVLARENGLGEEFADMYIEGEIPALCDAETAAIGKLETELKSDAVKKYNNRIPADPIAEYLKTQCEKEAFALLVRKKGKSLEKCLEHVEKEAKKIVTRERPWLHDTAVYKMARAYYAEVN